MAPSKWLSDHETKACTKCRRRFLLEEFRELRPIKNGKRRSYLASWCKQCTAIKSAERSKERFRNDPEYRQEVLDRKKKWIEENEEHAKNYKKILSRVTRAVLMKLRGIFPDKFENYVHELIEQGETPKRAKVLATRRIREEHRAVYENLMDTEREKQGLPRSRRRNVKNKEELVGGERYRANIYEI